MALAAGLTDTEAERAGNVARSTITARCTPGHAKYDPAFAHAIELARLGALHADAGAIRGAALAYAGGVVEDAWGASRPTSEHRERDRVANRRLLTDLAQLTGQAPAPISGRSLALDLWQELRAMRQAEVAATQPALPAPPRRREVTAPERGGDEKRQPQPEQEPQPAA